MGEFYNIGLQCGKTVAEAVDKYLKEVHVSDHAGENMDPANTKALEDGSKMYKWYMKWAPYQFIREKGLIDILKVYSDVEDDEDKAYKFVAVGDEGGSDEYANTIGYEIFDGLYRSSNVVFPEDWEEQPSPYAPKAAKIMEISEKVDLDTSAEYMSELLYDDNNSSYKMFEELVSSYITGNDDVKKGIDIACAVLTGYNLDSIADNLLKKVSA